MYHGCGQSPVTGRSCQEARAEAGDDGRDGGQAARISRFVMSGTDLEAYVNRVLTHHGTSACDRVAVGMSRVFRGRAGGNAVWRSGGFVNCRALSPLTRYNLTAMAGERIGIEVVGPKGEPYKLADYLGHGAFGDVYRGIGTSSGAVVAVKLLPVNELENPDSRIALLNEIRLAQQVSHPNVVSVLHVDDNASSSVSALPMLT